MDELKVKTIRWTLHSLTDAYLIFTCSCLSPGVDVEQSAARAARYSHWPKSQTISDSVLALGYHVSLWNFNEVGTKLSGFNIQQL